MRTHIPIVVTLLSTLVLSGSAQPTLPLVQCTSYERDSAEANEFADRIDHMCSLGCAIRWTVATPAHPQSPATSRNAVDALNDGRLSMHWMSNAARDGIGDVVMFIFPSRMFIQKDSHDSVRAVLDSVNFNGFRIVNGDVSDSVRWLSSGRVKSLRVFHNKTPIVEIVVNDNMLIQEATIDEPIYLRPNDNIAVHITGVYPGLRQRRPAIAELVPLGAH